MHDRHVRSLQHARWFLVSDFTQGQIVGDMIRRWAARWHGLGVRANPARDERHADMSACQTDLEPPSLPRLRYGG
jgi:hypothetical protein